MSVPAILLSAATHVISGASPMADTASAEAFVLESAGMELRVEEVYKADGVVWAMDFIDSSTLLFTLREHPVTYQGAALARIAQPSRGRP